MRYVLGLGGTVDYEIRWDSAVLEDLARTYRITPEELSTAVEIRSERDLVVSVLAFVRDGAGGERFVAASSIIASFASRFDKRITLGGTPVRAAIAMDTLGISSTVHLVSIDDHVRRLLPAGVSYLCSADQDTTDPHLIVQYPRGTRVRVGDVDLQAPHPNRLIYANDPPNLELRLAAGLGPALRDADVFLISGFNVIQDPEVLDARLAALRDLTAALPPAAFVMFEDAGYHVPAFAEQVTGAMVDVADVYSLNEDEMQSYLGHTFDLLDPEAVAAALRELHRRIPAPTLVVHTRHWALAHGERARSLRGALHGGITMASTRYCFGDGFTERDYRELEATAPGDREARVATGIEAQVPDGLVCVPALTLTTPTPTTIGLGDTFVGGFLAALDRR